MKQYGYVTEVYNDKVKVRVVRESSCGGNCVSCKGCPAEAVTTECVAVGDLSVGDRVCLTIPEKVFYRNTFLGYGLTTLLMILGAIVGYVAFASETASVLGTFVGLAAGLTLAKFVYREKTEIKAEKEI